MNKISFALLKYFSLFAALLATISNLIYGAPRQNILLIIELSLAFLYVVFSIADFLSHLAKINRAYERFFYLPLGIVTFKFIKIGAFAVAASVLFLSKSNLVFLSGLLVLIIVVDLLIFALRVKQRAYYISLFENYVLYGLEEEEKIFASQIKIVEYRYGIFYLELKNGKIFHIETERMEKKKQAAFIEKFVLWVVCNNLHFTDEAREKLADVIADAI